MVGDYRCRCALLLQLACQQIAVGLCHHQHVVHGEHLALGVAPFIVCNGHHITHFMAVFGAAVRAVEALAAAVPCASFNGISVGRVAEVEAEGRHILARQAVVAACCLGFVMVGRSFLLLNVTYGQLIKSVARMFGYSTLTYSLFKIGTSFSSMHFQYGLLRCSKVKLRRSINQPS